MNNVELIVIHVEDTFFGEIESLKTRYKFLKINSNIDEHFVRFAPLGNFDRNLALLSNITFDSLSPQTFS